MLRIRRSSLTWLALWGLITPAAARADLPSAWPVLPAASSAKPTESSATLTSYYADDSPAQSDLAPSASEAPAAFQTAASTVASTSCSTSPSCSAEPSSGLTCMGDCRCRCWKPFITVEALFLAPLHNTASGASYSVFDGSSSTPVNTFNSNNANGMIVTPRLWMGIMGECWGVGVRYWRFANGAGGTSFPSPTSQGLNSTSFLRLQTFDLEAVRRLCYGNSQGWATIGARYAQFGQGSGTSATDIFGGGFYTASAASGAGFNGTGITGGLYGLTPIGCSCWNLFYGGRASYLWDNNAGAFAQTTAAYGTAGASAASTNFAAGNSGNAGLFIGEIQLGAQYNHALQCFPGSAFFRIAFEYQYWHVNNGVDASSASFAGADPAHRVQVATNAGNSSLGLIGFGISTGFMW